MFGVWDFVKRKTPRYIAQPSFAAYASTVRPSAIHMNDHLTLVKQHFFEIEIIFSKRAKGLHTSYYNNETLMVIWYACAKGLHNEFRRFGDCTATFTTDEGNCQSPKRLNLLWNPLARAYQIPWPIYPATETIIMKYQ